MTETNPPLTITIHRASNGDVSLHAPDADSDLEIADVLAHVHESIIRAEAERYAAELHDAEDAL